MSTVDEGTKTMVSLPQIPQTTQADEAVVILREAILSGVLKQGTPLREIQLADGLAIGRGPLREALLRLEEEGLVQREAYRGSFVAEVGVDTITEIEELRTVLEPFAAFAGLRRLREGPVHDNLVAAVESLERAAAEHDYKGGVEAHLAVHRAIYEASDNQVLIGIWSSWQNQMRLFMTLEHRRLGDLREIAMGHRLLLTTLESGDRRAIRRGFAEHIRPEWVAADFDQLRSNDGDNNR
ncbi:GntR family transcriptional regulator [Actinomadura madurae]|uniref:GntR family transcriptional regulator n=1 Tax=Actinomadura madurae TaxID=1993 RepID=UPI0039995305